jgi:cytochrome c
MRLGSCVVTPMIALALVACSRSGDGRDPFARVNVSDGGAPGARTLGKVLVFTRTTGYRHDSIRAAVTAIQGLGRARGFGVQQTEDAAEFNDQALAAFQVVVFVNTTADVLDPGQQAAFERYIAAGNGWVGVHSAADTEYDWPWYGGLLGGDAWFLIHPPIQTAELQVEQAGHPSTAHLPASFMLQDEWYNYRRNPRPQVNVLLRLNEASYQVGEGAMGDHPIAWYHEYAGGRAWYTGLGHRSELYSDPQFLEHLLGGIRWAAGASE